MILSVLDSIVTHCVRSSGLLKGGGGWDGARGESNSNKNYMS